MRYSIFNFILFSVLSKSFSQKVYESDVNFRVEAGSRTCFFERGKVGQVLEAQYEVLDGQHGDLDINFEVIDPNGEKLITDYKKAYNSIILDLSVEGDYVFCLDNSYSLMNSKLVFVYVMIEGKEDEVEAIVPVVGEKKEEEILEWTGTDKDGHTYFVEVKHISDSLSRTLKKVVRARHLLDMYGAMKTRDSYLAFEETFVVDVWSAFQICVMCIVGLIQVYMIKKLFNSPAKTGHY